MISDINSVLWVYAHKGVFIYRKIFLKIFQSTRTSSQFHLGDTPEGKKGKSLGIRNGRR